MQQLKRNDASFLGCRRGNLLIKTGELSTSIIKLHQLITSVSLVRAHIPYKITQ